MVNTITTTFTSRLTLSLPAEIETVIGGTGRLLEGLYGTNTYAWTITNRGFIRSTSLAAIDLAAGGTITNVVSRRIAGALNGIQINGGTGLVVNAGTITSGSGGAGIVMSTGTVTNQSSGTIAGTHGIMVSNVGTINNAGSVQAAISGTGVVLTTGGTVTNQSTGRITGKYGIAGGDTLVVDNAGFISGGTLGAAVAAGGAGTITNQATGTLTGNYGVTGNVGTAATVSNAGSINGTDSGIYLRGGGSITNLAGGTITGGYGIAGALGSAITATNAGTIIGTDSAVYLQGGGAVTNQATGVLQGTAGGVIFIDTPATLTNAGTVSGGIGVGLFDGGAVTNQATGTITGSLAVSGGNMTVDNLGLISGTGVYGTGIVAYGTSSVTNRVGGTISASYGIMSKALMLDVDNSGVIAGGAYYGRGGISATFEARITNQSGGTISGRTAIQTGAAPVTINNAGIIKGDTAGPVSAGIYLGTGGTITNDAGGSITGYLGLFAAYASGNAISISNAGLLSGQSDCGCGQGVYLFGEATVTNLASGTIRGSSAILAEYGATLTVSNAGTLAGNATYSTGHGVWAYADSDITNQAGGVISGYTGVGLFSTANTLRNAGTIIGSGGTAVALALDQTNLLQIDAGAVFTGLVNGGNGTAALGTSTMELTSSASTGTLTGLGTDFINFTTIAVNADAKWALTGTNAVAAYTTLTNAGSLTILGGTFSSAGQITNSGTIRLAPGTMTVQDLLGTGRVVIGNGALLETGGTVDAGQSIVFGAGNAELSLAPDAFGGLLVNFFVGDTIDLSGITDVLSASVINVGTLFIDRDTGPDISLLLDPSIDYSTASFFVTNEGDGDFITTDLACFVAGTRLDTPDGPVAVEKLAVGDKVLTAAGLARRVKWIGWRHLDPLRHQDPDLAQPIEISAGAIASGIPARAVRLSPEHAIALDGMLIPARLLTNGTTIRQDTTCRSVTYFHVELDSHDLLLAEGMAAESYLDTGNRSVFANAGLPLTLHPDFGAGNDQARRDAESCLPFVTEPDRVRPVWRRLAGHIPMPQVLTTDDPDLRIQVDGRVLRPVSVNAGVHVFAIPARSGTIRLLSRACAPHAIQPWNSDRRTLGVAVRGITIREGGSIQVLPPDHPALTDGWWTVERDAATLWRWTSGDAMLPLEPGGPAMLEIRIGAPPLYLAQAA